MKKVTYSVFLIPFFTFGQWIQIGSDIDGEAVNDQSGTSVDLNADGNIIAIGSPFNDDNGEGSGQVCIFENQAGSWEQIGADIDGSAQDDSSGFSVSISDDGTVVAIGAPDKTANGFESGQVRVFENQSGNWVQIGDEIIGEAFSDHSGFSVSLSGDGTTVAIGAPDNEGTIGGNFGHVRVYANQAGNWTQIGGDIDGEAAEDNSGYSVALNEDGTVVAIGAPFNDDTDSDAGHVRVYANQAGNWEQIGGDIDGEAANDRFGNAVKLSDDGSIVAIAGYDNNSIGHVRVFENQSGTWVQIGDDIDGETNNERFGFSMDLNATGDIVAIGAPLSDGGGLETGRVKIYQNQSGNWTQIGESMDGEALMDRSGFSVSLSADGSTVGIGAYLNDGGGSNSGHVRVYANSGILSLDETDFQDKFIAYPNPTSGQVTVDLGRIYHAVDLVLYDSLGREIIFQSYTYKETVVFTTENLPSGVYTLKVYYSKNSYQVLKIQKE